MPRIATTPRGAADKTGRSTGTETPMSRVTSTRAKRWLGAMILQAMILIAGVAAATPALAAGTYSTTGAINVRNGPSTSSAVITSEPQGASFTLLCQWQGGTNVNRNSTWDYARFSNGVTGAISDYWTNTPSWNSYAPNTGACSSRSAALPSPGPAVTTGVNMQQACTTQAGPSYTAIYRDRNSAFSWACVSGSSSTGINVTRACVDQNRLGTIAGYRNASDAFGWYCQYHTPPATARNIGYNPFAARYSDQCTYYAEVRMHQLTGMYMPVYGNAYQWASQAQSGGWTVGAAPALYAVAVFPQGAFGSSVGHVGFVLSISGSSLLIADYNWNHVGAQVTVHWVTAPAGTQYIFGDR
jgi:surface antigen/uncharacterized protein YraI